MSIGGVSRAELGAILSSPAVTAEMVGYLEEAAGRVRASAPKVNDVDGCRHEIDLPVKVDSQPGSTPTRAALIVTHPAALNVEAKHALLARSI